MEDSNYMSSDYDAGYYDDYGSDYDLEEDDSPTGFNTLPPPLPDNTNPSTKAIPFFRFLRYDDQPNQLRHCMVITKESLMTAQMEDLERVMDLLSLKKHNARTLLIHYRWEVDKVISVFVEKGKDVLFAEAGVKVVEHDVVSSSWLSSIATCNICFEDVSAYDMTTMDCGHFFCNDCWTEHFVVKINEGSSRSIKCMSHNCNAICDETKINFLVGARDTDLAEKFDRFLLESYIEDNRRVKWCPSVPHCGNAIQVKEDEICEIECVCGLQFCFTCSSEAHSPCSCQMWQCWSRKCQDESETVNWITAHTKACPKCNKLVEKSEGCNLVVCVCKQPFCWLCGGATGLDHTWTTISGHSCGRFKEELENNAKNAKRDLQRYIHYHSRYKAHIDSMKLESKLKETTHGKISRLEERESSGKDFSWVTYGICRLFRSRRVLSYSYPFAYYMFGEELFKDEMTKEEGLIKPNLFEDQQQQFEAHIEKLSSFLGEDFHFYEEEKLQDLRQRIIALSNVTDKLCQNLYDFIENDMLGNLKWSVHKIAPYKSNGVEKAAELSQ